MGIFSRKKEVNIEDFCRDFYDNIILNPVIEGVDVSTVFYTTSLHSIEEVDPDCDIDPKYFTSEIRLLQFELFALAWTHKFLSGMTVINQNTFTKHYLHEKSRDDIWNEMKDYNNIIDGGTLNWLTKLGKINLGFNYRMREDLSAENTKDAQKNGMKLDEVVERVNNRVLSENAWKQGFIIEPLMLTLRDRLGLGSNEPNEAAQRQLTYIIRMIYDGAKQSLDKIKIK